MWKLRNFTATIFAQKCRESNFLSKSFTLNWFDEKILHGSEFLVFQIINKKSRFHEIFVKLIYNSLQNCWFYGNFVKTLQNKMAHTVKSKFLSFLQNVVFFWLDLIFWRKFPYDQYFLSIPLQQQLFVLFISRLSVILIDHCSFILHSVEIAKNCSHHFSAIITWKQRIH